MGILSQIGRLCHFPLGRIAPRRAVVDVCFLSIADLECSFSLVVTILSNIRSEF